MCIYIYICIYICICQKYVNISKYTFEYTLEYIDKYIYIFIYWFIYLFKYVNINMCIYICKLNMYLLLNIYIHIRVYLHVYLYIHKYVCVCVYRNIFTYTTFKCGWVWFGGHYLNLPRSFSSLVLFVLFRRRLIELFESVQSPQGTFHNTDATFLIKIFLPYPYMEILAPASVWSKPLPCGSSSGTWHGRKGTSCSLSTRWPLTDEL